MASISITLLTTSQTLDGNTEAILIDATNNLVNVTLPAITADGDSYVLSRLDASLNSVGVVADITNTINNSSSIIMLPGDKFRVIAYGTNYYLF